MTKFYVYEDWTLEEIPRCFYVGKGTEKRIRSIKRNAHHTHIVKHLGIKREIVFTTEIHQEAIDYEIALIATRNTFNLDPRITLKDIRCNRTIGGEGVTGHIHSEESKRKNSESNQIAQLGDKNGMYGRHHSEESRKLIGDNQRGWTHTEEAKRKIGDATIRIHTGLKRSEETKRKISDSCKGRIPWNKGLKKS